VPPGGPPLTHARMGKHVARDECDDSDLRLVLCRPIGPLGPRDDWTAVITEQDCVHIVETYSPHTTATL